MNTGLSTKTLVRALIIATTDFAQYSGTTNSKSYTKLRRQYIKFTMALWNRIKELEQIKQRYEAQGEGKK